jgi:hypothetical protein
MRMGFSEGIHLGKPLNRQYSKNPFTKVNGNLYIKSYFISFILPSALADGFYKLLLPLALATFWFVSIKRLIQYSYPPLNNFTGFGIGL